MRLLFIGDVVGKPGREVLVRRLQSLREETEADLVVVNGENAAGGVGLTPAVAEDFFALGVDAITLGNHAWDKKELIPYLEGEERIIRPANYPEGTPGRGMTVLRTPSGVAIGLINLSGRVFSLVHYDCPFRAAVRLAESIRRTTPLVLVDFHAEATSEKIALGWHLDGVVSAVIGTHTHVQTADERVLPDGTAYITDAGMTGPRNSVIGVRRELVLERFLNQRPLRFSVAEHGPQQLNGVLLTLDEASGRATEIERIAEAYA